MHRQGEQEKRRGGSHESRAGQKEKREAQQGKKGEDTTSTPPQFLVPAHPVGRASNQDEICQRSEARRGKEVRSKQKRIPL